MAHYPGPVFFLVQASSSWGVTPPTEELTATRRRFDPACLPPSAPPPNPDPAPSVSSRQIAPPRLGLASAGWAWDHDAISGAPVADRWASLPEDLVRLVASRVLAGDLLDYVRFRAVCTPWRFGAACPRGRGVVDPRFHPRRWMMLPEGHGLHPGHPDLRGYVRFINLDTGAMVRAQVPLLADHCAVDSVDGLLLLLREEDTAVRLLHPFTGDVAELPPLAPLVTHPQLAPLLYLCSGPQKIRRLAAIVCASASFSFDGVITVMLALHRLHHVVFATTLDRQWTLPSLEYQDACPPPLSFQGKLYIVCHVLYSTALEIFQIDPPVKDGVGSGNINMPMSLVECDSEILLLGHKHFYMSQLVVFKLTDLVLQRCIPVTSIRGNTLFIAERSLSVAPKALPTTTGDTVVYPDPAQHNLLQYHLISGTWSPATDECSMYGPAPGPCSLIHLIYSCSYRNRWNRGLVFGRDLEGWFGQV